MADRNSVASLLEDIADKLEFLKENRYRVIAFRNGAEAIRKASGDFEKLISQKRLKEVKGIGKGLESVIYEYFAEGYSTLNNELSAEVPSGIEKLLKVKALTPDRIRLLYDKLNIKNLEELEKAAAEKKLTALKGFTENLQEKILAQLQMLKLSSNMVLLITGYRYKKLVQDELGRLKSIKKFSITGEMRRGAEVISSVQFVLLVTNEHSFTEEISSIYNVNFTEGRYVVNDRYQIPIIFYLVKTETEFNKTLFITTGSDEFIKSIKGSSKIPGKSEEAIFEALKFPFVIPEMREEEFIKAKPEYRTNSDLIREKFNGLLHFHSTYSDATETLENMITSAFESGFKFAAVCDHSKYAFYANGLTEERVLNQTKELKILSKKLNIVLFQGIECDILKDGSLDFEDDFLTNIDFVVVSIHKRFSLDKKEMTARMIKAVENPYADMLAHPSGRFLLQRDPYEFDTKKVIDACAVNKVAIEINSNPKRLDLDWRWIYYAREKGCLFSINPDAHSIPEINFINFGIKMARKGGMQASEVINCFDTEGFKKFLNRKVKRKFKINSKKN